MRSAVVAGMAVVTVAVTAFVYRAHRSAEHPDATSPVIIVARGAATSSPAPAPTWIAAAAPVALTSETPPHLSQQAPLSEDVVPLVDVIGSEVQQTRDRLANERREDDWAARSESVMRASYDRLKGVGSAGRKIDIVCGTSICQVSGSIADMPGGSTADVMDAVQSEALRQQMAAQGYELQSSSFGPGAGGRQMFISYYKRITPRPGN